MMHRTVFGIGEYNQAYIGYTDGSRWNGWATPHFEIDEAMRVMAGFNECAESPMHYDADTDTFYVAETDSTSAESWKGCNITTKDGLKHLYGIGAYSWVWDDMNDWRLATALQIATLFDDNDQQPCWWIYDWNDLDVVADAISTKLTIDIYKQALIILKSDKPAMTQVKELINILWP